MSGFTPNLSMSNYDNYQRVFRELRMHPWIPEHKVFIEAELARMSVTEPREAKELRERYDAKMAEYLKANGITETVFEAHETEKPTETVQTVKPKRRSKKSA